MVYSTVKQTVITLDVHVPIIDSSLLRGVGSIVNHKQHNQTNVYFKCDKVPNSNKWLYKIIARRDIRNGEELYVNYGDSYGDFKNEYFPRFDTVPRCIKHPSWY